jgi:hypothetical protein
MRQITGRFNERPPAVKCLLGGLESSVDRPEHILFQTVESRGIATIQLPARRPPGHAREREANAQNDPRQGTTFEQRGENGGHRAGHQR